MFSTGRIHTKFVAVRTKGWKAVVCQTLPSYEPQQTINLAEQWPVFTSDLGLLEVSLSTASE